MEAKVSEILENILGLLGLEGSFEVSESDEEVKVSIETEDAGRLIGYRGETLDALQLLVNIIANKGAQGEDSQGYKRVVVDVQNWRKNREEDLVRRAKEWADQVRQSKTEMELESMPSWQRRIVHMTISEEEGVESESVGEGNYRHLVIRPTGASDAAKKEETETAESTPEVTEPTSGSAE